MSAYRRIFAWHHPSSSLIRELRPEHYVFVPDLWLIANQRATDLSDAETVRLGRVLVVASGTARVWYPPGEPTPTVVVKDFAGELSPKAAMAVTEVLGPYRSEVKT